MTSQSIRLGPLQPRTAGPHRIGADDGAGHGRYRLAGMPPSSNRTGRARRRFHIPITWAVFAITLTITIVLVGTIVVQAQQNTRQRALVVANELMAQSVEIVRLRAAALIDPIDAIVEYSRYWDTIGISPTQDGHPVRDRLLSLVRNLPQVSSIYLGYDDGDYYSMSGQRSPERLAAFGAPSGTAFVEQVILRSDRDRAFSVIGFLDTLGNQFASDTARGSTFDPRTRPWYRQALATDDVVRTGVYRFAGSGTAGLSVSRRHDNGVVGVDITLGALEQFLDSAPQAATGLLALVGEDGQVLARSAPADAASEAAQNRLLAMTIARTQTDPAFAFGTLDIDGHRWIVRVSEIGLGAEATETLVVAMPVSDVIAPIQRETGNAVLVSLFIFLLAIPLIWLISARMSRPLLRLVAEADRIRRFDLGDGGAGFSRVDEIERLQRAMAAMRANLRMFAIYVPKTLVKLLAQQGATPAIGGTRRDVTVLFMDLENFTPMAAGLEPEAVMARMSDYFEAVTRILLAHDATIDKYIGDGVMAFWNAPVDTPDHAGRACRAALEIADAARLKTRDWSCDGIPPVRTRIGVHCGDAVVGNVGSSDRMNYTALGSTVNLAARLEKLNRDLDTEVLISGAVAARVEGRFTCRPAGEIVPTGFRAPVAVFELIDGATPTPAR